MDKVGKVKKEREVGEGRKECQPALCAMCERSEQCEVEQVGVVWKGSSGEGPVPDEPSSPEDPAVTNARWLALLLM